MTRLQRLDLMSKLAHEITLEYRKCCIELGLNPNYIQDNINDAPNYNVYYSKCLEYRNIARIKC